MSLAVDTLPSRDASSTRNDAAVTNHPLRSRNASDGGRVPATWACCFTHVGAEHWAEANLRHAGYRTYLPMVTVQRRARMVRTVWHSVRVPAFARYVLVQHADGDPWTPIAYLPGIARLLTMDAKPAYLSAAAVSALQAALASGRTPTAVSTPWASGEALRWLKGPFQGLDAVAIEPGPRWTLVSAIMLGGIRTIRVSNDDLARR